MSTEIKKQQQQAAQTHTEAKRTPRNQRRSSRRRLLRVLFEKIGEMDTRLRQGDLIGPVLVLHGLDGWYGPEQHWQKLFRHSGLVQTLERSRTDA